MNEQERAEQHLRTIRRLMERATIYRAISAPTALTGGLLSLFATAIWHLNPHLHSSDYGFVFLWMLVLLITAATNVLIIAAGAKQRNEPVFSASMKAALVSLAPPFISAAVFTALIAYLLKLDLMLGAIWAIFYGLGLLATAHFAPRSLLLLGWAFLFCGLLGITAVFTGFGIERFNQEAACAIFMAATFGVLHLIYAVCAWPRGHTADS